MRRVFRGVMLFIGIALLMACNQQPAGLSGTTEPELSSDRSKAGRALPIQREFEYEITLENLSPATADGASQPFSPPLVVTHSRGFHIYRVGSYASEEMAQIAQDANSTPMLAYLDQVPQVYQVTQGDGVVFPGSMTKIKIKATPGFHKLSLVTMLVNTNDAFTGVDAVNLPRRGSFVYNLKAYDAGSEKNTELAAHIPGPCCGNPFMGIPTHERIKFHAGIKGIGDLDPEIYGWSQPVARLTVKLIK